MTYLQLARSYPNYIGYGMLHYFMSSLGQTFLISVFVPFFVSSLGVTNNGFSVIYAFATLTSASLLPFAGKYIDAVRLRMMSLICGMGLIVACLIMANATHLAILFFGLFALRFFGQGGMVLIGSTAVARYFDHVRGKALSMASTGLPVAEALMPVLMVAAIHEWGLSSTWFLLGVGVALFFIPATILLVDKYNPFQTVPPLISHTNTSVKSRSRSEVLRDWKFYLLLPAFVFLPFFITGIFIHQNLVAEAKGWSIEWIAACFVGFGIARIVTNYIAGSLIDRFSAQKVFVFYLIPLMLALLVLQAGNHPLLALLYMILLGITASLQSLTGTAIWAEIYGVQHLGAIKSMTTTIMIVASAIGPVVIGWAFGHDLFLSLNISIGAVVLITCLSGFVIGRTK
jgi:MFS family permease